MDLSPELKRSLRTRWQRWESGWGAGDGISATSEVTRRQLSRFRPAERAYSPTSLQTFAACPYKFLLSAILNLSPRRETVPLQMLDPLTRGHMYHAVLARFLRKGLSSALLPLTKSNLCEAQAMLDDTLRIAAAEYHEELAPAIESIWQDEVDLMRADLRGWLTQTAERTDGYLPEFIEFGFGLRVDGTRDPSSTPDAARLPGGWLLHGIIDLIEKHPSGVRRITDHKTGKDRTAEGLIIQGGEVLQPILYSLAIEQLLGPGVIDGRLSFCTAAGGYSERVVAINSSSRRAATDVLETIDRALANSFLPAAPKKDACKYCDMIDVCGPYEERRVGGKDPRPLAALERLRSMQ